MQNPLLKVAEKRHEFQNMEWLNLHTSVLDSPEVLGEEPINRATWLFLLRYCIGQENKGRIYGAVSWGDRKWQQLVRVTLAEVKAESSLWRWVGDDLEVKLYPIDAERLVQLKRKAARRNGNQGGRPKKTNVGSENKPTSVISAKAKGKEREGEGNERELGVPPCTLPKDHKEAIAFAGVQMIPPDFIRETFDRCMAVGWIDTQGRAIASWPHYLAKSYADAKQRSVTTASRPGAPEKGITFV